MMSEPEEKIWTSNCMWCKRPVYLMLENKSYRRFSINEKTGQYERHVCKGFKVMTAEDMRKEFF